MTRALGIGLALAMAFEPCSIVQAAGPGKSRTKKTSSPPRPEAPADPGKQAQALYNAGKYLEAAAGFEALAPENPKYLYYAGLAREALGHDAQAILHWEAALAGDGLEANARAKAQSRLAAAKQRTTAVRVTVTPAAAAAGAEAELYYQGGGNRATLRVPVETLTAGVFLEPGAWVITIRSTRPEYRAGSARPTLDVQDAEATVTIAMPPVEQGLTLTLGPARAVAAGLKVTLTDAAGLEPARTFVAGRQVYPLSLRLGRWSYVAEATGYASSSGEITVTEDGPREVTIALKHAQRDRAELRPLAIGTGVTSAVLAIGGGVGMALSERGLANARNPGTDYYDAFAAERSLDGLQWTSVILGASVGFLGTAVTAAVPRKEIRRRAWIAEAATGSAAAIGGSIWGALRWSQWVNGPQALAESKDQDPQFAYHESEIVLYREYFIPSLLLLGAGASLLVGATTGLISERRQVRGKHYARRWLLRPGSPLTVNF